MQFDRSFVDHLTKLGFTAVGQPVTLRPLDLIGVSACRTYAIGRIEQLVAGGSSVLPTVMLGKPAPDVSDIRTDWAPAGIAATFLHDRIVALGGHAAYCTDFTNADVLSVSFPRVAQDRVSPEGLKEYLEKGRIHSGDPIVREFLLSGGDVYVITALLKSDEIELHASTHGSPMKLDIWAFISSTGLGGGAIPSGQGLILLGRRAVVLAVECSRLVLRHGRLALEETRAPLPTAQGGLLPPLEPWTPARPSSRSEISVQTNEPVYEEYIVVPDRGIRLDADSQPEIAGWFGRMHGSVRETVLVEQLSIPMFVLDSVAPSGPKLVRLRREEAAAVNRSHLGWKVRPVVYYRLAATPRFDLNPVSDSSGRVRVHVQCAATGSPVEGAEVIGVTDWTNRVGARGITDVQGDAVLALGAPPVTVERLYCRPPLRGFWGAYRASLKLANPHRVTLEPVNPGYTDGLRYVYGNESLTEGTGVKVAVIDTGIGPHPDIVVCGGENVIGSEPPGDYADNGVGHGTHVAGIIAARGTSPQSVRGLAPAIDLYSYRVFPANSSSGLKNYFIIKALIRAIDREVDVVNLSLGQESGMASADPSLEDAFKDARDNGCVLVAAAGNDGRQSVGPLASYVSYDGFCVSAVGRRGTFPAGALEESDVDVNPQGSNPNDFVAEFSNIGNEVSLIAPGVGIISTAIKSGFRPLSGTSMAAPAVAGFAARVIATNRSNLPKARDALRAKAILQMVVNRAQTLGFPYNYEGRGVLK